MEVHAFVGPTGVLVAGAADGPLAGTTLAVKDVIDVVGRVTGAGNPDLAASRRPAERSAPVVDALVAAGATVVGKTVTDELAYSLGGDNVHYPPPVNAAAPGRTTGGSSSGSAAAVTAGIVDLALGTDTGGSIRVPASYCGVLGWRPTHGAVSTSGVTPLAPSFDTVGLFARSGRLLRAAAEPLLGTVATEVSTRSMALASGRPVHLAWAAELLDVLDQHVVGALTGAVADLFGDAVRTAVLGIDLEECLATFRTLQGAEAWAAHGEWIRTTDPVLGPATAARFRAASAVTGEQVAVAQSVRERVRRSVIDATLDDTVLVAAGATGAAPVRAGVDPSPQVEQVRADTLRLMSVAGLSGAPVVVLPGAVLSDGTERLPLGVALIGTPGSDLQLLDFVQHVHVARL